MSSDDKTDPGIAAKVEKATKRLDPFTDSVLKWTTESAWTPWILAAVAVALIVFGAYVAW